MTSTTTSTSSLWLPAPTRSVPPPPPASSSQQQQQQQQQQIVLSGNTVQHQHQQHAKQQQTRKNIVPSYEERCNAAKRLSSLNPNERRQQGPLFVPRSLKDFDDGGSFPEIHVAQYPKNLGNPHKKKKSAATVGGNAGTIINVEIDSKGEVSYDAVVKGGTNTNRTVYTKHEDVRGITSPNSDDIALPTAKEEEETAQRTSQAIQSLVSTKLASLKPTGSAMIQAETSKHHDLKTQFVKYTPNTNTPGYNPSASKQRVIQMVPAQVDPMAPPKHKHRKAPRGPAEDPVPVLHAPPKKLTKEEADAWKIPACISNWKNTRGYTIPLDKRLAADGRGLREHTINSNFATLSESLYVAERQAREEVRMRALVQKRLGDAERERREEELRILANKARLERTANANAMNGNGNNNAPQGGSGAALTLQQQQQQHQQQQQTTTHENNGDEEEERRRRRHEEEDDDDDDERHRQHQYGSRHDRDRDDEYKKEHRKQNNEREEEQQEDEIDSAREEREKLRIERRKEREREYRLERSGKSGAENNSDDAKRRRLEEERDVSEKIALGIQSGAGGGAGGAVDSRLYNLGGSGMSSGFGPDDEYNAYTKPLFDRDHAAKSIYKPSSSSVGEGMGDGDQEYEKLKRGGTTEKFRPDVGFAGADGGGRGVGGGGGGGAGPRTEPVQFERSK